MGTEIPGVTSGHVLFEADKWFWFNYVDSDAAWHAGRRLYERALRGKFNRVVVATKGYRDDQP